MEHCMLLAYTLEYELCHETKTVLVAWEQYRPSHDAVITSDQTLHYCRTSMARTSLGPWKFVRDMGSSSHWRLIMAQDQEANGDKLGNFFSIFYTIIVCWVYSLEHFPKYVYVFWTYRKNFIGTQKRVQMIHGKRAIGVRAIEVLLYLVWLGTKWVANCIDPDQSPCPVYTIQLHQSSFEIL